MKKKAKKKLPKITAVTVKEALAIRHKEDVFVEECKLGDSWSKYKGMSGSMDGWAMVKSWARPLSIGYEVKVSRRDFVQDDKWTKYLSYCNQFYFVCPKNVMDVSEVPEEAGLMYISSTGTKLYIKKKAPRRNVESEDMASLYKYVLMSRSKITKHSMYNQERSQLSHWESFVRAKEEDRHYGGLLSGKIRKLYHEKIQKVEAEIFQLRGENLRLQKVKEIMEVLGIRPHSWNVSELIERKLKGEDITDMRASVEGLIGHAKTVMVALEKLTEKDKNDEKKDEK